MSSSTLSDEEIGKAAALLFSASSGPGLSLFVTTDGVGRPHATWMATTSATDSCEIVTLTSPDSRKARNVEENPYCECLFSDEEKTRCLYLEGSSEVVRDPVDIKRYWTSMVDKDRAYFLNYYNSGLGFVVLLTRVSSGRMVFPEGNRKVTISPSDLWTHHDSRI